MKVAELLQSAAKEVAQSSGANKPMLRGLHHASIKRNLIVASGLCVVSVIIMKIFNDSKKNDYAEFYKTYDANKSFEKIKAAGWFDSCK